MCVKNDDVRDANSKQGFRGTLVLFGPKAFLNFININTSTDNK